MVNSYMKFNFVLAFLLCFASTVYAQEAAPIQNAAPSQNAVIQGIEIFGNERVEDETIRLQLSSRPGEPMQSLRVSSDIKDIFKLGFFKDVTAKTKPAVGGGVILAFFVKEKPAIRKVNIEGEEELDEEDILEKLSLGTQKFLDTRKIDLGIEELKKAYQEEGLYGTKVEYKVKTIAENQVDLDLDIDEGEERKIRVVSFEGSKAIEPDDLSGQIDTSRYKWWSSWITGSGTVKEEQLDSDVRKLSEHYLKNGYAEVKVGEPVVSNIKNGLKITYKITEGDKYSFGNISVQGTLLNNSPALTLEGVKSKKDQTFNVEYLRQDTFSITDKFTDIGYAFANVEPLTKIVRSSRRVDIQFQVSKGDLVNIDRILFSGNTKTKDNVIRRSLKMNEQELFSSSKIKRSQELLQRLGYFDEVTIVPEPTDDKKKVNLNVGVKEAQTGTFSIGAGVSSGNGVLFNGRVSENNLFGSGNSLSLDLSTGTTANNFLLSFLNPRVNDTQWSLETNAQSALRRFNNFDRTINGVGLTAGYPLWFLGREYLDDVRGSIGYEYNNITIDSLSKDANGVITAPQLVQDQAGSTTASSIIPRLVRNTIDNPLDPTKGSRQNTSMEVAGLGGDQKFWLAQFHNAWFYPVIKTNSGDIVFSQRFNLGWGETSNSGQFPLFRRFFPGGIDTNRGFAARQLGPKDAQGNFYGGNKQILGNFEMIYPISQSIGLKGVFFYDVGNAFDDDTSVDFSKMRHAVGWGFRWRSPIAPIRIEIGYPLNKEEGDSSTAFNFSLGSPL